MPFGQVSPQPLLLTSILRQLQLPIYSKSDFITSIPSLLTAVQFLYLSSRSFFFISFSTAPPRRSRRNRKEVLLKGNSWLPSSTKQLHGLSDDSSGLSESCWRTGCPFYLQNSYSVSDTAPTASQPKLSPVRPSKCQFDHLGGNTGVSLLMNWCS